MKMKCKTGMSRQLWKQHVEFYLLANERFSDTKIDHSFEKLFTKRWNLKANSISSKYVRNIPSELIALTQLYFRSSSITQRSRMHAPAKLPSSRPIYFEDLVPCILLWYIRTYDAFIRGCQSVVHFRLVGQMFWPRISAIFLRLHPLVA